MSLVKFNGANRLPASSLFQNLFNTDWPFPNLSLWNNEVNDEWMPPANVKETDKSFKIQLSVPGYDKEDISVKVENQTLFISGEHETSKDEEDENYTRKEFTYGSFSRSFALPDNANEDDVKAKCKKGMLSIEIAKKPVDGEKANLKKIEVQ